MIVSRWLVLVIGFVSGCRAGPADARVVTDSSVDRVREEPPTRVGSGRRLVLGRVVDLATLKAVETPTASVPREELTDPGSGVAIARLKEGGWGQVEAFSLATGKSLWRKAPPVPCDRLVLGRQRCYALCGDRLVSFALATGSEQVVDRGPGVQGSVITGSLLASYTRTRVSLIDLETQETRQSKRLAELAGADDPAIVPNPAAPGVCVYGRFVGRGLRRGWGFKMACYDGQLSSMWRRAVSFDISPGKAEDIYALTSEMDRQAGPHHLVLSDQQEQDDTRSTGVIVRWRDGQVTPVNDRVFATLEDSHGERITDPAALAVFAPPPGPTPEQETFGPSEASVRVDRNRAYVLSVNRGGALSAVDLVTRKIIFRVPISLGNGHWSLEVASGLPIVRTRFTERRQRWRATIHDPDTGRILYEDERGPS
jgi:hypothetical protein